MTRTMSPLRVFPASAILERVKTGTLAPNLRFGAYTIPKVMAGADSRPSYSR